MTDLVQVDIDTAFMMYSMGETHIRCLQRDVFSDDWTNMQPLYLDEILNGLTIFVSDKRRAELLNPPKVDVAKVKEEIALEFKRNLLSDDEDDYEDDDPDWTEEPAQVETIPDDDEVPEFKCGASIEEIEAVAEKMADNTPEAMKAYIDDTIEDIEAGRGEPLKWNIRDVIRYREKGGISTTKLGKVYGVSPQTVINRINQYKMK
jgi:hypothetical protein